MTEASLLQRGLQFLEENDEKRAGLWLVWLLIVLVRWLVGLHSYSGEHTPPMFGDYEAQRHWMEITINLPVSNWYFNSTSNDLLYWGLDYPPLTAYVSYLFGRAAEVTEPAMVELTSSRGYESATSKVFMRTSVLLCDVVLFIPAVYCVARAIYGGEQWTRRTAFLLLILLQPAILLIDHGHFQYNNVCLGFTALSVALIMQGHEFLGSISYCLALNFKQMALYYAPVFGVFLLSRCIYRKMCLLHLIKLAVAVIATFALMWFPFCAYTSEGETCLSTMTQVVHRIFPFGRGLFEDKVANFWCIADFVLKIRRHVTAALQMRLCTAMTLVGFSPSVFDLLRRKPTNLRFVLSLAICSLSFFLFSFQVHEKTILLPLLPISFLFAHNALLSGWFSVLSTFSMYFLLKKDGLVLPYIVLQLAYFSVAVAPFLTPGTANHLHVQQIEVAPGYQRDGSAHPLFRAYVMLSLIGGIAIHAAQIWITPPARYPHIHDYVFAAYSCGHFLLVLVYLTYWQWTTESQNKKAKKE
ncbi:putative dolichyl pyrophosphate Man9GlcNAc2 alpha-1,3-glucosyltransferase [Phytophthora fragariae]|uniref:Alpha-1,3-glucosyltransferase n=1 Tax=Phytophthora fragariae TaxID=53985 RepID=A0A6A4EQ31_9STRA|nr:putative dolichyl pyrophosphate Man9GlcNAc2 alpha-1,3-glucosyltransferase [Phytophthora fragariae]KAE8946680.1 putative dolichyl pyrophosphate Man9GlcNAc2 alpha-1,3-glucosyltransferase [Phytophthora fragariae]KAE9153067.1 putative dolichyl pyrophosphate Man9GlcNAc2 alpha-1,3-glucosyltransferase [Phytophthora fragariae]KAE9325386.1 putative dolichyl pyrophosphate Man9GlcNAc2 alpha-1,3-glucosyltransferase [Phytophthora fragariae]KAE9357624.1 putative dolichyl pyrophosphate Man9GlcNAc2 alpha-1,